jgi:hypothetical protein
MRWRFVGRAIEGQQRTAATTSKSRDRNWPLTATRPRPRKRYSSGCLKAIHPTPCGETRASTITGACCVRAVKLDPVEDKTGSHLQLRYQPVAHDGESLDHGNKYLAVGTATAIRGCIKLRHASLSTYHRLYLLHLRQLRQPSLPQVN